MSQETLCEWCNKEKATISVKFERVIPFEDPASFMYYITQYREDKQPLKTIEWRAICEECYKWVSKGENVK
jgi:hypothetical protein